MIKIPYKCECMLIEQSFEVEPRAPDEDILDWMNEKVVVALAKDHKRRSPWCQSVKVEYIKIPLPENAPFIGGSPRLDS